MYLCPDSYVTFVAVEKKGIIMFANWIESSPNRILSTLALAVHRPIL